MDKLTASQSELASGFTKEMVQLSKIKVDPQWNSVIVLHDDKDLTIPQKMALPSLEHRFFRCSPKCETIQNKGIKIDSTNRTIKFEKIHFIWADRFMVTDNLTYYFCYVLTDKYQVLMNKYQGLITTILTDLPYSSDFFGKLPSDPSYAIILAIVVEKSLIEPSSYISPMACSVHDSVMLASMLWCEATDKVPAALSSLYLTSNHVTLTIMCFMGMFMTKKIYPCFDKKLRYIAKDPNPCNTVAKAIKNGFGLYKTIAQYLMEHPIPGDKAMSYKECLKYHKELVEKFTLEIEPEDLLKINLIDFTAKRMTSMSMGHRLLVIEILSVVEHIKTTEGLFSWALSDEVLKTRFANGGAIPRMTSMAALHEGRGTMYEQAYNAKVEAASKQAKEIRKTQQAIMSKLNSGGGNESSFSRFLPDD